MNFSRLLGSLMGSAGGGMLGGMVGGRTGRMVGSLLGSMMGGRGMGRKRGGGGLLGKMMGGGKAEQPQEIDYEQYADQDSQDQAKILIQGMCNAAKADGEVSQEEFDAIVARLGDLDAEEEAFLKNEFQTPLDVDAYVATVPEELATEVYAVSLVAIKVDTGEEARYLASLAQGLGIDDETRKSIHEQLGAPWVND